MEDPIGNTVIPLHRYDLQKRMHICPAGNRQQNIVGVLAAIEHIHAVKIEIYDMDLISAGEEFYAAMRRSTNGGGENSPMLEGEDDFYELFFASLESL